MSPYRKTWWILLSDFFSPRTWIYRVGVEVGGAPGGPQGRGRAPTLVDRVCSPWSWFFRRYFLYIPKNILREVSGHSENFYFCTKITPWAILLKTTSVRVSSIQIMQFRVQNKGKSVWKSRYDRDVSTPPSLNLCLSSSNSVDKLKVFLYHFQFIN